MVFGSAIKLEVVDDILGPRPLTQNIDKLLIACIYDLVYQRDCHPLWNIDPAGVSGSRIAWSLPPRNRRRDAFASQGNRVGGSLTYSIIPPSRMALTPVTLRLLA